MERETLHPTRKDTEDEKSSTRHSDDPFDGGIGLILGAVKQSHASKSEDDDLSFFLRFEEERAPFIASAHEMIQQRFKDELKAVLAATDEYGVYKALKSQEKECEKHMAAIYYGVIEHFGNWNYERLKDEYDEKHGSGTFETKFFDRLFTMARRLIQKFIGETSVELVTFISETIREALRMVISDVVDKGLAWRDIGRTIEKVYGDDFDARRSMMIARTGIVAASNFGAREGAKATGLELEKQWVSTPDDRTHETRTSTVMARRGTWTSITRSVSPEGCSLVTRNSRPRSGFIAVAPRNTRQRSDDMIQKKSWQEFRESGSLWFANTVLHAFEWAIVVEYDSETGEEVGAYPAHVKFRGFDEESNTEGYIKLSQYMKDELPTLLDESKE